eukprot:TRINITY_DN8823_c0_g1_i1.p1 TRINITY_DN8823_c0_g1~~TRINITY_DN8823_c0_g1_i1.p1  ORF type:complete len:675 (+),score=57.94 TRINITY_DN8823_c0_g1_i1:27-2027(+)
MWGPDDIKLVLSSQSTPCAKKTDSLVFHFNRSHSNGSLPNPPCLSNSLGTVPNVQQRGPSLSDGLSPPLLHLLGLPPPTSVPTAGTQSYDFSDKSKSAGNRTAPTHPFPVLPGMSPDPMFLRGAALGESSRVSPIYGQVAPGAVPGNTLTSELAAPRTEPTLACLAQILPTSFRFHQTVNTASPAVPPPPPGHNVASPAKGLTPSALVSAAIQSSAALVLSAATRPDEPDAIHADPAVIAISAPIPEGALLPDSHPSDKVADRLQTTFSPTPNPTQREQATPELRPADLRQQPEPTTELTESNEKRRVKFGGVVTPLGATQYTYNCELSVEENAVVEFKLRESISDAETPELLAKVLNSFLNSKGGRLLLGVTDEGIVRGVPNLDRRTRDGFRLLCDDVIRRMHPPVDTGNIYHVSFVPVTGAAEERHVVQIELGRPPYSDEVGVFFTTYRRTMAFMRYAASSRFMERQVVMQRLHAANKLRKSRGMALLNTMLPEYGSERPPIRASWTNGRSTTPGAQRSRSVSPSRNRPAYAGFDRSRGLTPAPQPPRQPPPMALLTSSGLKATTSTPSDKPSGPENPTRVEGHMLKQIEQWKKAKDAKPEPASHSTKLDTKGKSAGHPEQRPKKESRSSTPLSNGHAPGKEKRGGKKVESPAEGKALKLLLRT